MTDETDAKFASSTGQILTGNAHLDRHFLACQPEYEAMLESVGLKSGWHVLDAGCGSGSFLPLMSQLLGASGQIQALDLAPENVALVESQQKQGAYTCPVTVRVGSIVTLPYEDDTFDAVWCGATLMYLTNDELTIALSELRRVLKPGGLLAVKEFSLLLLQWQPLDPLLLARRHQADVDNGNAHIVQVLRNEGLAAWVTQAGFSVIGANSSVIERRQPLSDIETAYLAGIMKFTATGARNNEHVSESDRAAWAPLLDACSPNHILNHPNFYHREGHIILVAENG